MPNDALKQLLLKKNSYEKTAFYRVLDKINGSQRARYQNTQTQANITGLSLLLQDNRFDKELNIFLDFKDPKTAQDFFKKYELNDFKPAKYGALEEKYYISYNKRPVSFEWAIFFDHYGYEEKQSAVKQKLQMVLNAVQDFDPLDKENFNHLKENFWLDMPNLALEKKSIYKKLYFQGAMTEFFKQTPLQPQLAAVIVEYLDDKTNRAIGCLNNATHEEGFNHLALNFKP